MCCNVVVCVVDVTIAVGVAMIVAGSGDVLVGVHGVDGACVAVGIGGVDVAVGVDAVAAGCGCL